MTKETTYIAMDGRKFDSEIECAKHEALVKSNLRMVIFCNYNGDIMYDNFSFCCDHSYIMHVECVDYVVDMFEEYDASYCDYISEHGSGYYIYSTEIVDEDGFYSEGWMYIEDDLSNLDENGEDYDRIISIMKKI